MLTNMNKFLNLQELKTLVCCSKHAVNSINGLLLFTKHSWIDVSITYAPMHFPVLLIDHDNKLMVQHFK